jgi:hypothetical protein
MKSSLLTALILAYALPALTQSPGGSVSGSVRDNGMALVAGVGVTLRGTDATFHFTTGADGAFRLRELAPGPYELTVSLQGSLRVIGDVFNLFNANTVLVRNNNIQSTTFNQIVQNLSPRILRIGLEVKF